MDIKVITRHAPSNYGSLLQSIATQTILERLGHNCEIIDYIRDDEHGLKAIMTSLKNKPSWNSNAVKRMAYILMRYPAEKLAEIKFEKMRKRYLKLTVLCRTHGELGKLKADIFMTGSDQVWGPTLNGKHDGAYFLSFVEGKPKLAYAASFGRTEFTEDVVEQYKNMLSCYNAITVREDSAVELLYEWGIRCDGQVLDPTLLLTADEWSNFIQGCEKKGNYVLVYQIHNDKNLGRYAKRFAEYVGLPIVRVSPYLHQISREGSLRLLPNMDKFLSYIRECDYMITDSFHGTAFALNFNRQFIEILPNNKTGSRNQSILQLTGLQDRIVTDYDDFSLADKAIDYSNVNGIIVKERKRSMDILKTFFNH